EKLAPDGLSTSPIACTGKGFCGPGLDPIRVDPVAGQYSTNWHTADANLELGARYRINVFVGDKLLGYADVAPTTRPGQLRKVVSGEYLPLEYGSTLPVKFWMNALA